MLTTLTKTCLIENIKKTNNDLIIFSAFVKYKMFKDICDEMNDSCKSKTLLLRGTKKDFVTGASDIDLIKYALDEGWDVYIDPTIHAKLYCFDKRTAIIGSANLTNNGMNDIGGNLEIVSLVDLDADDLIKIADIIQNSCKLNMELFNKMKETIESIFDSSAESIDASKWDFIEEKPVTSLFELELLDSFGNLYSQRNIDILKLEKDNYSLEDISRFFQKSNEFKWLLNQFSICNTNQLSFGKLSELLHNSIIANSRIYRKDVKERLNYLFGWIEALKIDNIQLLRYEHTTALKIK